MPFRKTGQTQHIATLEPVDETDDEARARRRQVEAEAEAEAQDDDEQGPTDEQGAED